MNNKDLIDIAKNTCKPMKLRDNFSSGEVGCAILSESGKIYTGVCIDLASGLGFCAEAAAIAEMLKNGESKIIKLAAAFSNGNVEAPCGRCREMIIQINKDNKNTKIILDINKEILLIDLLPNHWLEKYEKN